MPVNVRTTSKMYMGEMACFMILNISDSLGGIELWENVLSAKEKSIKILNSDVGLPAGGPNRVKLIIDVVPKNVILVLL